MSFIEQHIVALLNLVLLIALVLVIMKRPVRVYLATRSHQFRLRMDAAGRHRQTAHARFKQCEARLIRLGDEVAALLKEMQVQGMHERDTIMERARERMRIMHLDAQRQITHGMVKLRQEMRRRAITKAIDGAREEIRQSLMGAEPMRAIDNAAALITREMVAGRAGTLQEKR